MQLLWIFIPDISEEKTLLESFLDWAFAIWAFCMASFDLFFPFGDFIYWDIIHITVDILGYE